VPLKKRNITVQAPQPPDVSEIAGRLAAWFALHARDLPWRKRIRGKRNPYAGLVSEAMLQQTQVSRVIEKYGEFMQRFPTLHALADANESDVTAAWAGLGYYRRARNLHKAAIMVRDQFGGKLPNSVEDLRLLPGVGRYTAGAIASIVFNQPEPLVDGNVVRVLSRLYARPGAADDNVTLRWTWDREAEVARAAGPDVAACNEGLMELGATICTPGATPRCDICPLRTLCIAAREGKQSQIPAPKASKARARLHIIMLYLEGKDGTILIEQRPPGGLWAGLWQPPCLELPDTSPEQVPASVRTWLNTPSRTGPLRNVILTLLCTVTRTLTHRDVTFEVYHGTLPKLDPSELHTITFGAPKAKRTITSAARPIPATPAQLTSRGISNAHAAALTAAQTKLKSPQH
jgi:A/G-specific adenine glycosylase